MCELCAWAVGRWSACYKALGYQVLLFAVCCGRVFQERVICFSSWDPSVMCQYPIYRTVLGGTLPKHSCTQISVKPWCTFQPCPVAYSKALCRLFMSSPMFIKSSKESSYTYSTLAEQKPHRKTCTLTCLQIGMCACELCVFNYSFHDFVSLANDIKFLYVYA